MVQQTYIRSHWLERLNRAWQRRNVIWLHGVRRSGKTTLCRSVGGAEYFDCDLLSVRRRLADPETFWQDVAGRTVILDEVHRADDPALLLKIAADHFPDTRVIATGSSTLAATAKFSDSLTGRKTSIWLTPMISCDLADFGGTLEDRLWRGGIPPLFLAGEDDIDRDVSEWLDAYWARDIQELFRIQQRSAFVRFVELVLARSGGMFEATSFAQACEVSRPTVMTYLDALQVTGVATVVRPYSTRKTTEIVSQPKVYGFDTGFVRYAAGWRSPRVEDWGVLWEHYVLNEIRARCPDVEVRYWRTKHGKEIDFVLVRRGNPVATVECKWRSANAGSLEAVSAFRANYPDGEDYVVCSDLGNAQSKRIGDRTAKMLGLEALIRALGAEGCVSEGPQR